MSKLLSQCSYSELLGQREDLVKLHIGEFDKGELYFSRLAEIDRCLELKRLYNIAVQNSITLED